MLDPAPPPIPAGSDKLVHFTCFFAVSFAAIAFCRSARQFLQAGLFCAVAGVAFETGQYYIPSRQFEWADMAANLTGTVTGTLLQALYAGLQRRRRF
jgi:VanZ family protein